MAMQISCFKIRKLRQLSRVSPFSVAENKHTKTAAAFRMLGCVFDKAREPREAGEGKVEA